MTTQQPEALRQAAWLKREGASCQRHYDLGVLIERQHAELETLREKFKTYEDLGDAARLEIESLQDRIKTMAEEHADELMVAHLDGRMRAAQPAGVQQPGTAYAELPSYEHQRAIMEAERNASLDAYSRIVPLTSTESMIYERAFTNGWNRHASHGQAPSQAAPAAVETQNWNRYCAAGICLETDGVHDACCQRNATQQPTKPAPGEPWTGGEEWEALAWHLCAEENGEDACGELLWEGGPIPEPWGDRWMKYESDAKRMIELVRKFVAAPPAAAEGVEHAD